MAANTAAVRFQLSTKATSAAALGLALAGVWTAWALVAPAALLGAANGLSMPSAQAGPVAAVPEFRGTASGLAGFLGTLLGAAATQAVGSLHDGTPIPIAGSMVLASVLALAAALLARSGADRPCVAPQRQRQSIERCSVVKKA